MTQGSAEATLIAKEQEKWEAWASKHTEFFRTAFADDFVGIDSAGVVITKPDLIQYVLEQDVQDYAVSDFKLLPLSQDTVLLTFRATQHYTYHGQEGASNILASSIWVKRAGQWANIFHQETAVQQQ